MRLARLAIRQPIFICMVLLAITLLGVLSYISMGVDLLPDISPPVAFVTISYPGASPEDVETLVTKPVEQSLSSVSGVESISATSREGMAFVLVSFVVGYDISQGAQEVRERLDEIKRSLPDGAEEPVMRRFDPNSMPFITAALSVQGSALSPVELRRVVEEIVVPRLERLPGVASAQINGLRIQEIGVELSASKLKALQVSPLQVVAALGAENTIMPSGRVVGTSEDITLRTSAEFQNLDEISNVVVSRKSTSIVRLRDVADISPRLEETDSLVRVNGQDTLTLDMRRQSGSNIVKTASLVHEELKKISSDFPQLNFSIVQDDSTFIKEADRDVMLTLVVGAVLAAMIVLLFFRNMRNTLITVAGLPIVVIGTFAVISLLGFSRNIISLMALSLSIGLLIDDAIVVRENIFRHMEGGASARHAAENATGQIAFAVMAITLSIVAVFIPVAFTTGHVGSIFKEFGITVAVAVLISLFEAFTFAPLLSAFFAKPMVTETPKTARRRRFDVGARWAVVWQKIIDKYRELLAWSLRYRWTVLGGAVAIFLLSLWLITLLPVSFFPTTDPGSLTVGIRFPPGSTLEMTDQVAREVERFALSQPEVEQTYTQVSRGSGSVQVQLRDGVKTDPIIKRFRESLAEYGMSLSFSKPMQFMGVGMGPGGANVRFRPVVIAVQGPTSQEALDEVADQVIDNLRTIPGLRDVEKGLQPKEPELHVVVDRQRAANNGVSATTIAQTTRILVQGVAATEVEWQDQRMDVTVQLREEDRSDVSSLRALPISGTSGDLLPLYTVASIERGVGPTTLERQDRQGQILIGANLEGRKQGDVVPEIRKVMAGVPMPPGVKWEFSGPMSDTGSAFTSLIFALVLGLVFVYMVLASQFGSVIHPLTIMAAIPMSAIGAMLALVVVRGELTVVAMIGIILLMGLATKNSILLVDFIIRYRKEGQARSEAIITAGPVRIRPIMMTSLAIILGMVPTALGLGAAGEFRAPMAIAVIGGVFSSTLLSLVVVPVVYTFMDDIVSLVSRLFHRGATVPVPSQEASPDNDRARQDQSAPDQNETTR